MMNREKCSCCEGLNNGLFPKRLPFHRLSKIVIPASPDSPPPLFRGAEVDDDDKVNNDVSVDGATQNSGFVEADDEVELKEGDGGFVFQEKHEEEPRLNKAKPRKEAVIEEKEVTLERTIPTLNSARHIKKSKTREEAKKKAAQRKSKALGGRCTEKLSDLSVRNFSSAGTQVCTCFKTKGVNCYDFVDVETTRHYRQLMYSNSKEEGKKVGNYERRKVLYKILEVECEKQRTKLIKKGIVPKADGSNIELEYYLTDIRRNVDIKVCNTTFAGVLGLSKDTVNNVAKMAKRREKPLRDKQVERLLHAKEESPEYTAIVTYLETLAEDLSNHSPDCRVTELPAGFKVHFYDMFTVDWKKGFLTGEYYRTGGKMADQLAKPPSKSLFYRVWRNEFPDLKVPKRHNRFSKCDWCVQLKTQLEVSRQGGDHEEVNYWKSCLYEHYSWVTLQRRKYHKHRRKAAANPGRYMSWIIDAMDATKCTIPWVHMKPKNWETCKKRLLSQFVACVQHGYGTRLFMLEEELKKDGDFFTTLILRMLVDEFKRREAAGLPWPEVLYLQGDNAKDNKNKSLFQLCELLVRLKIFRKVKFSFLPVGHTHEDVDACFGAGSHMLRRLSAFCIQDVFDIWKRGWPSTKSFDYVHETLGFTKWFIENGYRNNKFRGTMYPGVIIWTTGKHNEKEQLLIKWKGAMADSEDPFQGWEEDGYTLFDEVPDSWGPSPKPMQRTTDQFRKECWNNACQLVFNIQFKDAPPDCPRVKHVLTEYVDRVNQKHVGVNVKEEDMDVFELALKVKAAPRHLKRRFEDDNVDYGAQARVGPDNLSHAAFDAHQFVDPNPAKRKAPKPKSKANKNDRGIGISNDNSRKFQNFFDDVNDPCDNEESDDDVLLKSSAAKAKNRACAPKSKVADRQRSTTTATSSAAPYINASTSSSTSSSSSSSSSSATSSSANPLHQSQQKRVSKPKQQPKTQPSKSTSKPAAQSTGNAGDKDPPPPVDIYESLRARVRDGIVRGARTGQLLVFIPKPGEGTWPLSSRRPFILGRVHLVAPKTETCVPGTNQPWQLMLQEWEVELEMGKRSVEAKVFPRLIPKSVRELQLKTPRILTEEEEKNALNEWIKIYKASHPKLTKNPEPDKVKSYWYYDRDTSPVLPIMEVKMRGSLSSASLSTNTLYEIRDELKTYNAAGPLLQSFNNMIDGRDVTVSKAPLALHDIDHVNDDTEGEFSDDDEVLVVLEQLSSEQELGLQTSSSSSSSSSGIPRRNNHQTFLRENSDDERPVTGVTMLNRSSRDVTDMRQGRYFDLAKIAADKKEDMPGDEGLSGDEEKSDE